MQEKAYGHVHKRDVKRHLETLAHSDEPPNAEQRAFLQTVAEQCIVEATELNRAKVAKHLSEPLRLCLMGMAGAGIDGNGNVPKFEVEPRCECTTLLQRKDQ